MPSQNIFGQPNENLINLVPGFIDGVHEPSSSTGATGGTSTSGPIQRRSQSNQRDENNQEK